MKRMTKWMALAGLLMVVGCVAYRAPVISYMAGPENMYNQERSGGTSRATNNEQQVADTSQAQTQTANTATADMASNAETTRQVGLKQGQAQTKSTAQGRDDVNAPTTSTGQAPVGHQGSDQLGVPLSGTGVPAQLNPQQTAALLDLVKQLQGESPKAVDLPAAKATGVPVPGTTGFIPPAGGVQEPVVAPVTLGN